MSKEKQKSILKKIRQNLEDNITKIENRTDINDDEKVLRIVKAFSATCAAIATQPIPGWDIFPLTAIQAYMGSRVASIRGIPISESKTGEIIKEILGVVGLGMLGQNFVLTAYKIGIPGLGGFMTIPLVYGATYAIGRVMDIYFIKKKKKEVINPDELKKMWKKMKKEGTDLGKKQKDKIWKNKDDIKA